MLLRSGRIRFELLRSSFTRVDQLREAGDVSSIFELELPTHRRHIGQAESRLIEEVAELLLQSADEASDALSFAYHTQLKQLRFSGFTIIEAHSQA